MDYKENERAVSVTSDHYVHIIEEFFLPTLNKMDVEDVLFQQDGATAHTCRISITILWQHFPGFLKTS